MSLLIYHYYTRSKVKVLFNIVVKYSKILWHYLLATGRIYGQLKAIPAISKDHLLVNYLNLD